MANRRETDEFSSPSLPPSPSLSSVDEIDKKLVTSEMDWFRETNLRTRDESDYSTGLYLSRFFFFCNFDTYVDN